MSYQPPFTVTPRIIDLISQISEAVGRLTVHADGEQALRLRRINRIRSIHGSLAIEGNSLSEEQITAVLEGKHVIHHRVRFRRLKMPLMRMTGWMGGSLMLRLISWWHIRC